MTDLVSSEKVKQLDAIAEKTPERVRATSNSGSGQSGYDILAVCTCYGTCRNGCRGGCTGDCSGRKGSRA